MSRKTLNLFDYILQVTIVGIVLVFVLYPFFSVFKLGVFKEGAFSLEEFSKLKDQTYLIKNSIKLGLLTGLFSSIFASSIALMTLFTKKKSRSFLNFILLLTMISPPFIGSLTYIQLFGRNGLITKSLLGLSINPYGMWGIIAVQTLSYTPLVSLMLISYLDSLDKTNIEIARSLGASTSNILIDIVLPSLRPIMLVAFMISFIRSLADFTSPMIIGGAYNTLATEAYLSIIAKGDSSRASAISILLFIPSVLIFLVYSYFLKMTRSASKSRKKSQLAIKKEGLYYLIFGLASFFIIWITIQYLAVFSQAITDKYQGKTYLTLKNISLALPYVKDSFLRSIVYGLIASAISSIIGLIISFYSFIRNYKYMKIIDFIANMPYIVPGTFFGIGYIFAFNQSPLKLTGTGLIVILNLIFRQLPMSIRTIQGNMTLIEEDTVKSARDLGADNLSLMASLVLPLSRDGVFLSFTQGFISCMTTIGSIIFLVYPSKKLATLVLFDLVGSGKYKIASVLSVIIILICLIMTLLSQRIGRGGRENVSRI